MPKIAKPLTHTQVVNAKPKKGVKITRLFDGGGLYLEISPAGSKLWRLKYTFNGSECRMSLGTFPPITLDSARKLADEKRELIAKGINPVQHKRAKAAQAIEAAGNTFEVVAREWHTKQSRTWKESHASRIMLRMENDVFPWLGKKPVADITKKDIRTTAERIADRGAAESAHRVLSNICQVMRYAVQTDRIERMPVNAIDIRGALPAPKPKNLAALTKPEEVAGLLRSIHDYRGSFVTRCALQLAMLTVVRPGELRQWEWAEINWTESRWEIPAHKMKGKVEHLVPLSEQAMEILRELQALTGKGQYVFPGGHNKHRPMSNNAVLAALRRMNYGTDEMSGHGVRAIFRTLADEELGQRVEWLEMQLAHEVKDVHGTAYNRTAFLSQRITMMQRWADYLESLRTGEPIPATSNIHLLKRA
jgi:integrase